MPAHNPALIIAVYQASTQAYASLLRAVHGCLYPVDHSSCQLNPRGCNALLLEPSAWLVARSSLHKHTRNLQHIAVQAGSCARTAAAHLNWAPQPDIEPAVCFLHKLFSCHTLPHVDHYPGVRCCMLQGVYCTPAWPSTKAHLLRGCQIEPAPLCECHKDLPCRCCLPQNSFASATTVSKWMEKRYNTLHSQERLSAAGAADAAHPVPCQPCWITCLLDCRQRLDHTEHQQHCRC